VVANYGGGTIGVFVGAGDGTFAKRTSSSLRTTLPAPASPTYFYRTVREHSARKSLDRLGWLAALSFSNARLCTV
jgi:hypothetical protein